jgi:hypothetical protein
LADLLDLEAHQPHQGLITAQQAGQGMHPLHPNQGLHPIQQAILHDGHHRAVDGSAVDLLQQRHHPHRLQELKKVIQPGPFIESIHPIDHLFAI